MYCWGNTALMDGAAYLSEGELYYQLLFLCVTFCVSVKMEPKEALRMHLSHNRGPAVCLQNKLMGMVFCYDFYNTATESFTLTDRRMDFINNK